MVSCRYRTRVFKRLILCIAIVAGGVVVWLKSRHLLFTKGDNDETGQTAGLTNEITPSESDIMGYTVIKDVHPVSHSDYFIPRDNAVNPFTYNNVLKPSKFCDSKPFLVIMVFSEHSHTNVRAMIRDTWGSVARGNAWPGSDLKIKVKLMFLFGKVKIPTMEFVVNQENKRHNDILQGDFQDSYQNLTLKTLLGLRYVADVCPSAEYVLKADEDTFTNVRLLYIFLQAVRPLNSVIGFIYGTGAVKRHGKWAVTNEMYPHHDYPHYASGNTYVLSRDLIECINNHSSYFPYLPIEDVFITGIMGVACHASLVNLTGITYWSQSVPDPEIFVKQNRVSANKVSPGLAGEIWREFYNFEVYESEEKNVE